MLIACTRHLRCGIAHVESHLSCMPLHAFSVGHRAFQRPLRQKRIAEARMMRDLLSHASITNVGAPKSPKVNFNPAVEDEQHDVDIWTSGPHLLVDPTTIRLDTRWKQHTESSEPRSK